MSVSGYRSQSPDTATEAELVQFRLWREMSSGQKLNLLKVQHTYPDVFLIQDVPIFQDQRTDVVLNPCLIIEVLSKSTQEYDRTDKFRFYRSIPEFCEYLLINQYEPKVEQYIKIDNYEWRYRFYEENHQSVVLNLLNLEMTFDDIYENVKFE